MWEFMHHYLCILWRLLVMAISDQDNILLVFPPLLLCHCHCKNPHSKTYITTIFKNIRNITLRHTLLPFKYQKYVWKSANIRMVNQNLVKILTSCLQPPPPQWTPPPMEIWCALNCSVERGPSLLWQVQHGYHLKSDWTGKRNGKRNRKCIGWK